MDAVKFLEEGNRMCQSYSCCKDCPANAPGDFDNCCIDTKQSFDATDAVAIVEKWSAAHPRKMKQDVFLEQYPEAVVDKHGVLSVCPLCISAAHRDDNGSCKEPKKKCGDCRREFWIQEVE